MSKKKKTEKPLETPPPEKHPEINKVDLEESVIIPEEDHEIIPFENLDETPPYETPPPGEGP